MSVSDIDPKKAPPKYDDEYELSELPEITQGSVTPADFPVGDDDAEYQARLERLGLSAYRSWRIVKKK
jgi:hypothetical protein